MNYFKPPNITYFKIDFLKQQNKVLSQNRKEKLGLFEGPIQIEEYTVLFIKQNEIIVYENEVIKRINFKEIIENTNNNTNSTLNREFIHNYLKKPTPVFESIINSLNNRLNLKEKNVFLVIETPDLINIFLYLLFDYQRINNLCILSLYNCLNINTKFSNALIISENLVSVEEFFEIRKIYDTKKLLIDHKNQHPSIPLIKYLQDIIQNDTNNFIIYQNLNLFRKIKEESNSNIELVHLDEDAILKGIQKFSSFKVTEEMWIQKKRMG